jgi:ribulose 1,5-bisphosphate carboxylase large subunit-like protein
MDLLSQINNKLNELLHLTKLLAEYGERYANAEHNYKVEISKEVMRLKDAGQSATLINLVVYGQPAVAKLRLQRDLAQVLYDSAKEQINSTKLFIRILEAQIDREWRG